jgi:hypothetical protein
MLFLFNLQIRPFICHRGNWLLAEKKHQIDPILKEAKKNRGWSQFFAINQALNFFPTFLHFQ